MRRLACIVTALSFATGADVCTDPTKTCDLNTQCALSTTQLSTGMKTFCDLSTTISPCRQCTSVGQNCYNAPECQDSLHYCDYLSAAQISTLPSSHPCLSVPCQFNKNSPECISQTFQFCCTPGTPNCNNVDATSCTASGCSKFLSNAAVTVDYTRAPCPFADSANTCQHPQCNTSLIFQDIINTFAANQGCSGDQCISKYVTSVCQSGATVTTTTTSNKLECTNRIVSYCTSNSNDPGCKQVCPYMCTSTQPFCPCTKTACANVYKAPICIRTNGACANFKAEFKAEMFRQRFFQPRSSNLAYSKNSRGPPSGPFVWTSSLNSSKASCNALVANLADDIAACVQTSFSFCNANPWQPGCKTDLSTCGDGYVSWSETCDEGSAPATGGCDSTCRTAARWECFKEGTQCQRCIHETGYKVDGENLPTMCPFCFGLLSNSPWPCRASGFKITPSTLAEATSSDNYVAGYCNAIAASGTLRDPGCESYVNSTLRFSVPTIKKACEYVIKNITINAPQLYSLRFAIFTCHITDPLNIRSDVTPKFQFTNPLDLLSKNTKDQMGAAALNALNALYANRPSKLYPLDDLKLSDFYPYVDSNILVNNGVLPILYPLARLALFPSGTTITTDCSATPSAVTLIALPPTKNPLQWAFKAYMMRLKFMGVNANDASISDFANISPELLTTDSEPVKNTLQFAHLLSHSVKDAKGFLIDSPTKVCTTPDINSCHNVEDLLVNGKARLQVKNRLFDKSCSDTDTSCLYKIDSCRYVPLTSKVLGLNAGVVRATSANLVKSIQQITTALTPAESLQSSLQVASIASNEIFSDTVNLFWSAIKTGTQIKVRKNVANYCPTRKYLPDLTLNTQWVSDPCCNSALADYMCCLPRDVLDAPISVITGIQKSIVNAYCPINTDLMMTFLNGAYVGLKNAQNGVTALDSAAGNDTWSLITSTQTTCQLSIMNITSTSCQTDDDCTICSDSKCQVDSTTMQGTCSVPWDNLSRCMIECFSSTMDPLLLRYLKEDWNLTSTNSLDDFTNRFESVATTVECTGPMAQSSDIGTTGLAYTCNSTCQIANMCDDVDYQFYVRKSLGSFTMDFSNNATCTANGGRLRCSGYSTTDVCSSYTCTFDFIQSDCKAQSQCINRCQLPLTQGGCLVSGGTWYMDSSSNYQCCPPDAYFYPASGSTAALCTYTTPNTPALPYQIQDAACCAAKNGTWFMINDSAGQCCFGRIITIQNSGVNQLACQTKVTSWDVPSCLSTCAAYATSCSTCRIQSAAADCCGYQPTTANQTACLSKKTCNNQLLPSAQCNDPTPFCAKCDGNVCVSVTKQPTCTYEATNLAACTNAAGTWNPSTRACSALTGNGITGSDCLGSDICPSVTNFTSLYVDSVPAHPRRSVRCLYGCYFPSLDQATCVANNRNLWDSTHRNGSGICVARRNMIKTLASCDAANGVFVNTTKTFYPGAFVTEDQCKEGNCLGSPFSDGWSRNQCSSSSNFNTCTSQCSSCISSALPFSQQDHSGCISSDTTYCTNIGASSSPCLVPDASSQEACNSLTSTTWRSCTEYATSATCMSSSDATAVALKCSWSTRPCTTRATCIAQGQCNDVDNMRMICLDAGWAYGETCASVVTVNVTSNNAITSTLQTMRCKNCNRINGVCVAPISPSIPCPTEKSHPMGCRVHGVTSSVACTTRGGVWYTRATTQAQCAAVKSCKQPNLGFTSNRKSSECTKCKGNMVSMYTWTPGRWVSPQIDNYVWNPNGSQLISVNQWKPAISNSKLSRALARPVARRMASIQAQKALLMYNSMSDVLATLACACGANASPSCFQKSPTSTLVAQTKVFCGMASTIETGYATAVVSNTCPVVSSNRRLTASSESATLEWSVIPIAAFSSFPLSPYCDSSEINPLKIISSNSVVYGQLLGPGVNYIVTEGQSSRVQLCLSLSPNVHIWDLLFDTFDVATFNNDVFTPLGLQSNEYSVTGDDLCFSAGENATYFPIKRSNATGVATKTCSSACAVNSSYCVYNTTSQDTECLCRCGYTGALCDTGCPNDCSGHGTCSGTTCTCNAGYGGVDCSTSLCPVDSNNIPCSNAGSCNENGICTCNSDFTGPACEQRVTIAIPPNTMENPTTVTPAAVPEIPTTTTQTSQTETPSQQPTTTAPNETPSPTPTKSYGVSKQLSVILYTALLAELIGGKSDLTFLPTIRITMWSMRQLLAGIISVISLVHVVSLHWTEKNHLQSKAKKMFFHGYDSYMKHAYPWDELKPLSCEGRRWDRKERGDLDDSLGGFALTLIDSLSTLAIVDPIEFEAAVNRVIETVTFDRDVIVSVFETTIRVVGGLLSAHMLATSGSVGSMHTRYNGELLEMAIDVGTRLLPAFNTNTGIPHGFIKNAPALTCPAAAGSLLLEFSVLSRLSDIPDFEEAAKDAVLALWSRRSELDLLGSTINVNTGEWIHTHTGIGAGLDSFYEYLMKYYIISGDGDFFEMFNRSYVSIEAHVLHSAGYHVEVDMTLGKHHIHSNRVSALQAFWPGLQVLAGDVSAAVHSHQQIFDLWNEFGALPEMYDTAGTGSVIHWGQHYPLRPELAESTYHLYSATKDEKYLKVGRKLLQDIEETTRVECGYAAVASVHDKRLEDRMDSFFLSETVKYLYLLFSNDTSVIIPKHQGNSISLPSSHVLFTTEGHLFPLVPSLYTDGAATVNKRKYKHRHRTCPAPRAVSVIKSKNAHLDAAVTIRRGDTHLKTLAASPAQFGHALDATAVHGELFASLGQVHDACHDLNDLSESIRGKIVLVHRGNCSFTRKALRVQAHGGIGMIAVNSKQKRSSHRLYSLSDDGSGHRVIIPVVMISRQDGEQLQNEAQRCEKRDLTISLSMLLS